MLLRIDTNKASLWYLHDRLAISIKGGAELSEVQTRSEVARKMFRPLEIPRAMATRVGESVHVVTIVCIVLEVLERRGGSYFMLDRILPSASQPIKCMGEIALTPNFDARAVSKILELHVLPKVGCLQ
jgi:hypothetical protein